MKENTSQKLNTANMKENIDYYGLFLYLFPYHLVSKDSIVVIRGGGYVGRQYVKQLQENGYCKVVAIIDSDENIKAFDTIHVIHPSKEAEYARKADYVVIAIDNDKLHSSIKQELLEAGYKDEQIICDVSRFNTVAPIQYHAFEYKSVDDSLQETQLASINKLDEFRQALKIKELDNFEYVRIGRKYDGGYVMCDDFKQNGIAYSFGINDDVSWDLDMAKRGYEIYQYDHTIDKLPVENKRFHFFRIGLADSLLHEDCVKTLEEILAENRHTQEKNMILKMDVEGAELGCFEITPSEIIAQFDQIVLEMHGQFLDRYIDRFTQIVKKITKTHDVVHVHGNNNGLVYFLKHIAYPWAIEVTFVKRAQERTKNVERCILPKIFDNPCNSLVDDVYLGDWNR